MSESPAKPYVRISDLLMDAFDEAVTQRELEIAEVLHTALELVMTRRAGPKDVDKRDVPHAFLESYERLEALRRSSG
jgi:hypothetical protein